MSSDIARLKQKIKDIADSGRENGADYIHIIGYQSHDVNIKKYAIDILGKSDLEGAAYNIMKITDTGVDFGLVKHAIDVLEENNPKNAAVTILKLSNGDAELVLYGFQALERIKEGLDAGEELFSDTNSPYLSALSQAFKIANDSGIFDGVDATREVSPQILPSAETPHLTQNIK